MNHYAGNIVVLEIALIKVFQKTVVCLGCDRLKLKLKMSLEASFSPRSVEQLK